MMRSLVAVLGAVLLIGCGRNELALDSAQTGAANTKPVTLRLKARVGDTYRFRIASTLQAIEGNDKLVWTMSWDEKATKVDAKSSTWKVRFYDVKLDDTRKSPQAKQRQKALEGLESSLTFDTLGRAVGSQEIDQGATGDLTFPKRPVKPGDTWEGQFDGSGPPMKVTFKLVKHLTERGKRAVLIEGVIHEGQMGRSVKPAQFVVDLATGKIIRATGDFELGQPPKMRMSYTLTQVASKR